MMLRAPRKLKLAVFKFTSCDGCQLSLLDCEDELLALTEQVDIAHFYEASSRVLAGPYDLGIVEGSISTPEQLTQIQEVRQQCQLLMTIGACATSGGIQALRNFANVEEYRRLVYARPEYVATLSKSSGIADHVKVDFELRGCPINKAQLLEVLSALLRGQAPDIRRRSVCGECKEAGVACLVVAKSTPCLGPVTQSGCNALCMRYNRGCFGCYGPSEHPNMTSLVAMWRQLGVDPQQIQDALRSYNAWAPEFRQIEGKS